MNRTIWLAGAGLAMVLVSSSVCAVSGGLAALRFQPPPAEAALAPAPAPVPTAEAIDDYHRGGFDICVFLYLTGTGASDADAVRDCNELVAMTKEAQWYDQESKGYEAP